MLAHYGYECQLGGLRCTGYATTVHHLVPSSQAPHLFWEPANLVAACRRCNYGGGARVAAENTRRTIEHLRALVEEQQQQQIEEMAERLARYEDAKPAERPTPAIHQPWVGCRVPAARRPRQSMPGRRPIAAADAPGPDTASNHHRGRDPTARPA